MTPVTSNQSLLARTNHTFKPSFKGEWNMSGWRGDLVSIPVSSIPINKINYVNKNRMDVPRGAEQHSYTHPQIPVLTTFPRHLCQRLGLTWSGKLQFMGEPLVPLEQSLGKNHKVLSKAGHLLGSSGFEMTGST